MVDVTREPGDIGRADVLRLLKHTGVAVTSLRWLGAGDFMRAWIVNNALVIRVARHAEAQAALEREATVLPWAAPRITTTLPHPTLYGPGEIARFGYVLYPRVPGTSLTRRRFLALTAAHQQRCAAAVAEFFAEFHALRPPVVLPAWWLEEQAPTLRADTERLVIPRVSSSVAAFLETVLHDPVVDQADDWVVLHGDFGPPHLLVDTDHRSVLSGVIDFGDMQRGPAPWDVVYLYEDLGFEFVRAVLMCLPAHERELLARTSVRLYHLSMIAWAISEIEAKGQEDTGYVLSALERLVRRSCHEPWQLLVTP